MFGVYIFAKLAERFKKNKANRKLEDVKLPGFLSIFNENMVERHDMDKGGISETGLLPSFVVIEGKTSVINNVIALRGNGRFELVKIHK